MDIKEALTFDDVLLVPGFSEVLPKDVSLSTQLTRDITLNVPLLSAAMDTVTESSMAIAMAQEGGIGIIHKNMSAEEQAKAVKEVKKFESGVVSDPITISPTASVRELLAATRKHKISGLPVVDGDQLVGIVTHRDWRFESKLDKKVSEIMTQKDRLVTVDEKFTKEEAMRLFRKHRLEKLLVTDGHFHLKGMLTVKDIEKAKEKPFACKDSSEKLRVGAAVGTAADTLDRVALLVEAGLDLVVVDTAHGHSAGVINMVKTIKKMYPSLQVIGGNIATADAAIALKKAGADGVKVGIGPGSICTTRIIAGVGVPQVSAIHGVASALKGSGVSVIADGGIRYSGDVAKALAAGANCVMIGSLLAGTDEAPGEIFLYQGRSYKSYRGMGSIGAMGQSHGSSDRYFQSEVTAEKLVPEGIEGRVPYKGSMFNVVHQLLGGLRSSMGYTGVPRVSEMPKKCRFVRITSAGVRESHVHDVTIVKEAPNYQAEK
ncbi:MAG: IMP dehydrogenase [Legionellales bacterium]|nr:IMP dehydrogenase [Legionellales bacterium]